MDLAIITQLQLIKIKAGHLPVVSNGEIFDACYCIEENDFNGQVKLQLRLKDLRKNV